MGIIVTEEYKKNCQEVEKFLKTLSFSEESKERIRKYLKNPVDVVNDKIKAIFDAYDKKGDIVDFRIPLSTKEMLCSNNTIPEVFSITELVSRLVSFEKNSQFLTTEITESTIENGYFMIGSDKRKVWRYLDSKAAFIAESMIRDGNSSIFGHSPISTFDFSKYSSYINGYVLSIGSRKTALKTKIDEYFKDEANFVINCYTSIESLAEMLKRLFKIMSEIIGARLLDVSKYALYTSFNAFDWLFASTGETFHSCIDMESGMCYGLGLLGMCGCPDWGMIFYTNGEKKTVYDITSLHIINRSWICYRADESFQIINWYPRDINCVIDVSKCSDPLIRFAKRANDCSATSYSSWKPITFFNGAISWIYSDLNKFIIDNDGDTVHFNMSGACGISKITMNENGKLVDNDSSSKIDKLLRFIKKHGTIGKAVKDGICLEDEAGAPSKVCPICGREEDEYTKFAFITSENIYVCEHCLKEYFSECSHCGTFHRYENLHEVFFGPELWHYDLECTDCMNADGAWFDKIANRWWKNVEKVVVKHNEDNVEISVYTLQRLKNINKIEENADGTLILKV